MADHLRAIAVTIYGSSPVQGDVRYGWKADVSFLQVSYTSMPASAITIMFGFILGCLTSLVEWRASRFLNTATLGGAFFHAIAILLALGISLFALVQIETAFGVYVRENHRVVLAGYLFGYALLTVLNRWRFARR